MFFIHSFLLGILAAASALVLQIIFSIFLVINAGGGHSSSLLMIIASALIEEVSKYFALFKLVSRSENKNKFFLISFTLGLSFALTESFFRISDYSSLEILSDRFFWGAFVVHLTTAIMLGFFLSRESWKGFSIPALSISIAFLIHLGYNLAIFFG